MKKLNKKMKRRITKKQLRHYEKYLARNVRHFLFLKSNNADEIIEAKQAVCWGIRDVLYLRLKLENHWYIKERWLDDVIGAKVIAGENNAVLIFADMVWGLIKDVGGSQWKEPFEAEMRIRKKRKHSISYRIKFSDERSLEEKNINTGSYEGITDVDSIWHRKLFPDWKEEVFVRENESFPDNYYKFVFIRR